ncbi:hypothetical protein MBRA1_003505 [Malassezia brasiliensis]|uniref:Dynactin subunit 4 n=1 Tax=Malassezia brasiliensis TaxID=1821822 RepID=A0AAF0IPY5_9BASI|nr:hypothetical protein MBRA1_003505 [Malassezia brasiliensis]
MTTTYLCACAWDDVHTARQAARIPTTWPTVAPPPGVPLSALYFCETCYELRCNACVACEVSSRFCPHCLFEVPSTSARAQKAQCARSCLACPVCGHVVTIHGSDPPRNGAPLTSAEASIGVAPFYYACTACLWDSKRIGLVGAKPSALQASLPSASEPSAEQRAFDDLARHVAHHLGARPDADATRVPRVLADLPALPAHYWQGRRAPPPPVRDELPVPAVHTTRAQSKQITREAKRAERLAPCSAPDTPALAVSTLAQRYRMPLEQPYEAHALRPQRVRLRAKLAKRCATCAHLLVPSSSCGALRAPISRRCTSRGARTMACTSR